MFQSINPSELSVNMFSFLKERWALLGAGNETRRNAMTVSWGGIGVLFHQYVATVYVRPQRYTYELIEENPEFTLSFFPEGYRTQLSMFGKTSGRNIDKIKESGLRLASEENSAPYFEEAELVFLCRKLYCQTMDPKGFLDPKIHDFYENQDYHRMYIGEITNMLVRSTEEI